MKQLLKADLYIVNYQPVKPLNCRNKCRNIVFKRDSNGDYNYGL
nr:MAG TPA: hypothetical protein [Caudoviricetes sp.]